MISFIYKAVAPILRRIWKDTVASKPLAGTNTKLHYPKGQHLGFLRSSVIHYESGIRDRIDTFIKPGSLVLEVGSNIGQYTLWLSEKIGPQGKLIAIEPDPANLKWLQMNVDFNACQNVTILPLAVSDKTGSITFYQDSKTGGRSSSLIKKFVGNNFEGQEQTVEATTLQDLYNKYGTPSFVKVDVEGAEELIFTDDASIHDSIIYMIEFRESTGKVIADRFTSADFKLYIIDDGMMLWNEKEALPTFGNFLCIHKSISLK